MESLGVCLLFNYLHLGKGKRHTFTLTISQHPTSLRDKKKCREHFFLSLILFTCLFFSSVCLFFVRWNEKWRKSNWIKNVPFVLFLCPLVWNEIRFLGNTKNATSNKKCTQEKNSEILYFYTKRQGCFAPGALHITTCHHHHLFFF